MATPSSTPVEEDIMMCEVVISNNAESKAMPIDLDDLCQSTRFTRQEIRFMYRGLKTDCPNGVISEDRLREIYSKFFPCGNCGAYVHYLFKAFDVNNKGTISFRDFLITLSKVLRGPTYERLQWIFKFYDVDGDGCIYRKKFAKLIHAIHDLTGQTHIDDDRRIRNQVDYLFRKFDLNRDGVITIDEFIEACLNDNFIVDSIQIFDKEFYA